MKKLKRFLVLTLTIVTLVVAMGVTASASNYEDSNIPTDFSISFFSFKNLGSCRSKEDTSTLYLYITNATRTTVQVQALGTDSTMSSTKNLTVADGVCVDYVTCARYVQYNIHSDIYEDGYRYATLAFRSPNVLGDTINGVWSPDSIGTYTDARP